MLILARTETTNVGQQRCLPEKRRSIIDINGGRSLKEQRVVAGRIFTKDD